MADLCLHKWTFLEDRETGIDGKLRILECSSCGSKNTMIVDRSRKIQPND